MSRIGYRIQDKDQPNNLQALQYKLQDEQDSRKDEEDRL
jgi:hypothetical protein